MLADLGKKNSHSCLSITFCKSPFFFFFKLHLVFCAPFSILNAYFKKNNENICPQLALKDVRSYHFKTYSSNHNAYLQTHLTLRKLCPNNQP